MVYINYMNLSNCGNINIKQFLEYLYEHPNDVIKSIALALDNVRLYVYGQMDQRIVIVTLIWKTLVLGEIHKLQLGFLDVSDQVPPDQ